MSKNSAESPFLDNTDDYEDLDDGAPSRCGHLAIHFDARRSIEIRAELKRLREDLTDFDELWEEEDDLFAF